jgi:hypothetical protein
MLCTEIVSDIQNNFCTHILPHALQKEELLSKIYLYPRLAVIKIPNFLQETIKYPEIIFYLGISSSTKS